MFYTQKVLIIIFFDYRNETAMLHIFFKDEHIIQFKRDRLYTIEDFVCKSLLYLQIKHLT